MLFVFGEFKCADDTRNDTRNSSRMPFNALCLHVLQSYSTQRHAQPQGDLIGEMKREKRLRTFYNVVRSCFLFITAVE